MARAGESEVDVLVVGSGPAGLAAALACYHYGLNFVLLERGVDLHSRSRMDPMDIASGVGGAGLFSDGKFSFYPSATNLWRLKPKKHLRQAYRRICAMIQEQKIEPPSFPENAYIPEKKVSQDEFFSKNYESKYMPLTARYSLIENIQGGLREFIHTQCSVIDTDIPNNVPIKVTVASSDNVESYTLLARSMIIANGRLGPLLLQRILPAELLAFQRLEVGFRIQQPADKFFLRDADMLDPKRIWRRDGGLCEWRTFCCCRNGEIVSVLADKVLSVSGRSDLTPTDHSSVGFHVRLFDPSAAEPAWRLLRERIGDLRESVVEPLETFLASTKTDSSRLYALFGPDLSSLLGEGLHRLLNTFDTAGVDAVLHAPAVEGVLYYPLVNQELRLNSLPVWVAGDASGRFRGLTAALVSGYFCGMRVADYFGALK